MSDYEPTKPYVYQPFPVEYKDGKHREDIFSVTGPGAGKYSGQRMTREEAERIVKLLTPESTGRTRGNE